LGWAESDRGVSYTFGPDVLSEFLDQHKLDLICRAHQVVEDGYEFQADRQLVTIFSVSQPRESIHPEQERLIHSRTPLHSMNVA
jgi:hypothetical protein